MRYTTPEGKVIRLKYRRIPAEYSKIEHWTPEEKSLVYEAFLNIRDKGLSIYSEVMRLKKDQLKHRTFEAIRWQIDRYRQVRQKCIKNDQ